MRKIWRRLWAQGCRSYMSVVAWAGAPTLFVAAVGGLIAGVVPALLPKVQVTGWLNLLLALATSYRQHRGESGEHDQRRSEVENKVERLEGRVETLTEVVKALYVGRPVGAPNVPPALPEQKDE